MEIRVVLKQPQAAIAKLDKELGISKKRKQTDHYFVPSHKDFFKEKPTREYLRLRQEEGNNQLGYHLCHFEENGSLSSTEEYETEVGDAQTARKLLQKVGMELKVIVDKQRQYYNYQGFELALDHIKQLGYFLEIEAKNVGGSVEEKRQKCFQLLDRLDLDWEQAPKQGYPDMVLQEQENS